MKFSVGYQLFEDDKFIKKIIDAKENIYEVYFSWSDFPNGRNSQLHKTQFTAFEAQSKQFTDLKVLSESGIKLNILFNAMCYGAESQSRDLFNRIGNTVEYFKQNCNLQSLTTTSPLIAKFIKSNFNSIDVRASVNMSIGTTEGMDYVKDYYDSFYIMRELNRDFKAIKLIKKWCDDNGKQLHALANSGCLNNCSAHTFHDNLVAHENEIAKRDNGYSFEGICKLYLSKKSNREKILTNTNFIRPEDTYLYDGLVTSLKLATRVSNYPIAVLNAYINKCFNGNILDLLEPNHSGSFYPDIIENNIIKSRMDNDEKLVYENLENAIIRLEE